MKHELINYIAEPRQKSYGLSLPELEAPESWALQNSWSLWRLFAGYFAVWFCFPQGECHLDKIPVNSHVVLHVNSFTEGVLSRASHKEKWGICRCLTVLGVPMLRLFSWSVQIIAASKMLNCVVIWLVPMLSVVLFLSVLKLSFSNSVFCLSDSPLPNHIFQGRPFCCWDLEIRNGMQNKHTTYSHLPLPQSTTVSVELLTEARAQSFKEPFLKHGYH